MYISARSDYALRALVVLAAEGRPLTAEELAGREGLPVSYLEAILLDLRRAGIVQSRRGPDAGYRFTRRPEDLTAADVMRVLDGPLAEVRGDRPEATQYAGVTAPVQELWIGLRASIRDVLERVTIAQLAASRLPRHVRKLVDDPEAWRPH
ncbi:MAG TPA: Rrf2 family transcriptional regulator [Acidimicrobiales bacterium]|nr:Rrf2 family transcriptional regulator [Acidimicrobiales bacterium]